MPRLSVLILASLAAAAAFGTARAQELPEMVVAKDLLLPCQEADIDARDGYVAHLECVGFVRGFAAAVEVSGAGGGYCIPESNRDDQLRRAFVRWVHSSFNTHSKMPVGEALFATFDEYFRCP